MVVGEDKMEHIDRNEFLRRMADKALGVNDARNDPALADVDAERADLDGDGLIRGDEVNSLLIEMEQAVDRARQGAVVTGPHSETRNPLDTMMDAALALAVPARVDAPPKFADLALAAAFPNPNDATIDGDAAERRATAVQYALGRLGFFKIRVDGSFGPMSRAALESFQASEIGLQFELTVSGELDTKTLRALDAALAVADLIPPASRADDPLAYLSDFAKHGISPIQIDDISQPLSWSQPGVQTAYGRFVQEYWPVLKENRVELDCKALALFFMDQFRAKVREDLDIELPLPRSRRYGIPESTWIVATTKRPHGAFERTEGLPQLRQGYEAVSRIEKLDPNHSMLRGPNFYYPGIYAHGVYLATTPVPDQGPPIDNLGDSSIPEIPVDILRSGDIIFIDHSDEGRRYDHTINVIQVERNADGRVIELVLAVASFDDIKDADSSTPPRGLDEVNNYVEEVTVKLDTDGRIISSEVTYSTEPSYLVVNRYSAAKTIMELKPGGVLSINRWG